ncbi:HAD-IA family hydrolase [Brevibacillus borstelensis]|uniref:HAD family hydrolase n=1 Tax=Brevibacillus borstelensis TaxID=45462 RepID=UPI0030BFC488
MRKRPDRLRGRFFIGSSLLWQLLKRGKSKSQSVAAEMVKWKEQTQEAGGSVSMVEKAYKLILFDLDDTLFDYSQSWESGMRLTIRRHALTAGLDEDEFFNRLKTYSDELWPDFTENRISLREYRHKRMEMAAADFGRLAKPEEMDDFQNMFMSSCFEVIAPVPDVEQCLSKLADRRQLGIVTNGPEDMAYTKLSRLGLSRLFPKEHVVISEVVGYHKPDRRIFSAALQLFDAAPEETLFVGDSWEADVAGSIEAGMDAVWINPRKLRPASGHVPLAVVERLVQLTDILA